MTMLGLHNLKVAAGSKKRKIRRGRGNASGRGNYSGRGIKGQRARSGGKSGLVLFGVKTYMQKIPKSRGFKSLSSPMAEVNLGQINKAFAQGQKVDPLTLFKKGLIKSYQNGVKVLGRGNLNKALIIKASAFSAPAKDAIVKSGGSAELIVKELTKGVKASSQEPRA